MTHNGTFQEQIFGGIKGLEVVNIQHNHNVGNGFFGIRI
jgi:hypothetical protein